MIDSLSPHQEQDPQNKDSQEGHADDDHDDEQQSIQICLTLQSELHNIGKSLSCPLCLCTLRNPTLLPCNHAFCTSCLITSFEPKHNRTISPRSGKHVYRNQCPICKVPCTKRCMQESEHLAGLVKAYKKTLRSFGLTPIVYDDKADIAMTQIEETVNFDLSLEGMEEELEINEEKKAMVTRTEVAPSLRQCHEHLEVSKGIQEQLKRAMKSMQKEGKENALNQVLDPQHGGKTSTQSAKELEKMSTIRKLDFLLKDQEKVVKVDERALIRAAVSMQKRRSKSNERDDSCRSKVVQIDEDEQQESVVVDKDMEEQSSDAGSNSDIADRIVDQLEEQDFDDTQHKFYRATSAIENSRKILEQQPQESQSQTFFSAPDEDVDDHDDDVDDEDDASKVIESLAQEASNEIATTQDLMDDAREKEAADRSGEWLEEEEEEKEKEEREHRELKDDMNDKMEYRNTSQVSTHDKFLSADSRLNLDNEIVSDRCFVVKGEQNFYPIGTIVRVADRTWPGVNKLGGVAKIVKVHDESEAGIKYDVAYVLGGREKLVDSSFVTMHDEETSGSLASTTMDQTSSVESRDHSTPSARPSRKSRRVDERKQVEEWIAKIDAEEMTKTEEDSSANLSSSAPKRLLGEKENVDGNKAKKKKKHCNELSSTKNHLCKDDASGSKMEGNGMIKSPASTNDIQVTDVDHILRLMSFKDILASAMSHYLSRLKMSPKEKKTCEMFYITTSSLSDKEQQIVKKMIQRLSTGKVKLKLLKDFNPYKTNILITATSDEFGNNEKIAKLRTMKAMRSALTGIPIVDASWCQACLDAKEIVLEADNCVTSLPTKVESYMKNSNIMASYDKPRDFSTASYGVLSLALCVHSSQRQPLLLFQNMKVFLAGEGWHKETTKAKDVQLLVKEGGGSLLPSSLDAIKTIKKHTKKLVVILCDDSDTDSLSGISSDLACAIRERYHSFDFVSEKPLLVVDSKWLFDSISCAKLLEASNFKPSSPIATSMWHLCT